MARGLLVREAVAEQLRFAPRPAGERQPARRGQGRGGAAGLVELQLVDSQAGTISGAAQLLHISQPAVTKVLQHCELQLGMPLFDRVRGKLYPTPEAQRLFVEVDKLHGDLLAIRRLAASLAEANWQFARGHNLKLTLEWMDPDRRVSHDDKARRSLVYEWTPVGYLHDGRARNLTEAISGFTGTSAGNCRAPAL